MGPPNTPNDAALAAVDAKFAEVAKRRHAEKEAQNSYRLAYRNLWRTHHWPHSYDRCTTIRGRHVCRRCMWFYVVAFATLGLAPLGVSPWPTRWDPLFVWALAVPATIDFVLGELSSVTYDARRQVAVGVLLGLAVGRGFYAELLMTGSTLFWGPVLVFGPIWFAAAVIAWMNKRGQYRDEERMQRHDHEPDRGFGDEGDVAA